MHPGDRCKRCGDTRANCVDAEASFTTAVHKGSWECHVDSISATAGTPATAAKEKGLPLLKHTGHGVTGMAATRLVFHYPAAEKREETLEVRRLQLSNPDES